MASRRMSIGLIVFILIIGVWYIFRPDQKTKPIGKDVNLTLTSPAFDTFKHIPSLYACNGKNIHPPFAITNVPGRTQTLALIIDDPDEPTGTFTHWVIWNIHADTTRILEGEIPKESQEGTNSAGSFGYTPLCSALGQHRYFFTLYALDAKLGLDGKAVKFDVIQAMSGHVLAQSLLVGVY